MSVKTTTKPTTITTTLIVKAPHLPWYTNLARAGVVKKGTVSF